ncbi:2,3-bisphosphoglycerate-independent phosphoglycerate mutase [Anabaena cylindrica FACHB-243]|uniref:2,3-bisphosphoglycerate-independent phosphoglycerate mutase n=1 Tax=Anabaena cylindrica (strain ATCC 27899 / PCC 7122) TaxID=272123 RepID=K9ZLT7_ANACC|nr:MULTISPECIES: 2,3-bisphosphoglycerate-independent phosphoglycerate mutase [Anabaena]AFZ59522.1 phosphoglycerate mutase [Anabaena cylindrica PCC 7122]MBD2418814.1 2,3-bisphosphoglycerate-independent phosphoglycerate mutase [Anabaena cylindrica FACHB-243]MBY5283320.1 2,3-bisphosphoglycerate-independent phosphoglycerate mutase [Anabaena sp. CCAP 1446/1C]MBY5306796.1 2,3-bisphosphoglycerate-independent phosphoglycerate mutase [Anabaena sp. CCAP 1446/1C]MCM2406379.1 2,3-bisphosphoglycerate-indep
MTKAPVAPVVLVILDGWGYCEDKRGNAIAAAKTPIMDSLWAAYPHTLIRTSGKAVGLPEGQMGNSEVGHLNIGAGRVVPQELVRISDAVEDGSLAANPALVKICQEVRSRNGKLHLIGLCSEGGVHSHLTHLFGLLDLAKKEQLPKVCIHAITDGRDTAPSEGIKAIQKLQDYIDSVGIGQIATISGRYHAMDRDHRWDRVQRAYDVMTQDGAGNGLTAVEVLKESYAKGVTDEFVEPVRITPGAVEPGDGVIFFNFRPDRSRQLTQAFVSPKFAGFERQQITPLSFVTFTQYDPELPVSVAFTPQNLNNILGEVIANHGLKQFRTAETEKYAHVTYFFNGGLEEPCEGEDRELVSSPMVATYDTEPAMSAQSVTEVAIAAIKKGIYSLVVMNYANPDMVGHTGQIEATVTAIQTVDRCLGLLLDTIGKAGGTAIITADHGNAEYMLDEEGNPWTAHTTNPVPLILVEGEKVKIPGYGTNVELRNDGKLADIAPTILDILQLPQPPEMTGISLLKPAEYDLKPIRTPAQIGL